MLSPAIISFDRWESTPIFIRADHIIAMSEEPNSNGEYTLIQTVLGEVSVHIPIDRAVQT